VEFGVWRVELWYPFGMDFNIRHRRLLTPLFTLLTPEESGGMNAERGEKSA
jgi:hypothetical protein